MFRYREVPDSSIIELTLDGSVSAAEFDEVMSQLERAIQRHGKIQVLEEIRGFAMIPPSKWWDDLSFAWRHLQDISHFALVTDEKWIEVVTKMFKPLIRGEVRYFHSGDIDAARAWLQRVERPTAAPTTS